MSVLKSLGIIQQPRDVLLAEHVIDSAVPDDVFNINREDIIRVKEFIRYFLLNPKEVLEANFKNSMWQQLLARFGSMPNNDSTLKLFDLLAF